MTEIRPGVHWVGAINWDIRECGAYTTPHGTTYNAYLVQGSDSTALVDAVEGGFADEALRRIEKHVDPEDVDYIVCNHAEPDHAGAIGEIADATGAPVVCREACRDALEQHLPGDLEYVIRNDGETLDLGDRTLRIFEARMLHWPESTFTYLEEENVLFPNDAFGQHVAASQRFADETDWVMEEAERYYAAILQTYSTLVSRKLDELSDLEVEVIAPAHGGIWRPRSESSDPEISTEAIVERYGEWSAGEKEKKGVVVYDTMWGSTGEMAKRIAEGLMEGGAETRVFKLRESDTTEIAKELLTAEALFLGSPTLNSTMFPSVGEFLTFIEGIRPGGQGIPFGSYGWASASQNEMEERLADAGFDVEEGLTSKYVPADDELEAARRLGLDVAESME